PALTDAAQSSHERFGIVHLPEGPPCPENGGGRLPGCRPAWKRQSGSPKMPGFSKEARIMDVQLFDTTLRDGTQSEGLSLSVEDKLKISRLLDGFGIHFIEGGYPGSNPKDIEFFRRSRALRLKHAKLTAFGSTRKVGGRADDDANLRALVDADTPVVCIFGKSWLLHVTKVLGT